MAYKTIVLRGDGVNNEANADGAIKPGMLVERTSAGKVKAHADATAKAQPAFALEDELQGNGISTDYSDGDLVQFRQFRSGDRVYGIIANGENIAVGDRVQSNGDGYLKEATDPFTYAIGVALEAKDMSDSSGADPSQPRTVIEIL